MYQQRERFFQARGRIDYAPRPAVNPQGFGICSLFSNRFQLPPEVTAPRPQPIVGDTPRGFGGGGRADSILHRKMTERDGMLGDWADILAGSAEGGEDTGPSTMGPTAPAGGGILDSLFSGFGSILKKTATDYASLKSREVLAGQSVKTANAQYQARMNMPPQGISNTTILTAAAAALGLWFILRKK